MKTLTDRLRLEFDSLNAERFGGTIPPYKLRFSRTSVYTHGCINFRLGKISVSLPLYEEHGWEAVRQTLLHEMTHALLHLEGGHRRHTRRFWGELERRGGVRTRMDVKPRNPWVYACPTCQREIHRIRRFRNPGRLSCGRCDERFNPKHRLYLKSEKKA